MGKPFWHPQLVLVFSGKVRAYPFAERRRAAPDIHGHVEYFSVHHTHQFALGAVKLIVQAAQDAFHGAGVVVLNKLHRAPDGVFKLAVVEAFKEKPAIIPKDLGFESHDVGYVQRGGFHQ